MDREKTLSPWQTYVQKLGLGDMTNGQIVDALFANNQQEFLKDLSEEEVIEFRKSEQLAMTVAQGDM